MSRPGQGSGGGLVRDLRSKAWCWQDKESIRLIRRHWQSAPPEATTLAAALGIYLVLTELASNSSSPATFTAPRKRMADWAGVSERTLLRYIRAFEALGLLRVEERRVPGDESVQLPNAYALLDPPIATPEGVTPTPPPTPSGDALTPPAPADPPPGRASRSPGGRADAPRPGGADATDREERPLLEKTDQSEETPGQQVAPEGTRIWARAQHILAGELSRANYTTWIDGLQVGEWNDPRLTLRAPSSYVRDWTQTRLRGVLEQATTAAAGRRITVRIVDRAAGSGD